ncbi:hypothetical protein [Methanotorris formicicus]|uniref:Uncharacterized protein n=1 Tax=Methanotorris formicicus Mc-S-70 TaxID=647171 RepID=H1L1T0_9EURY|nr:hypothetical protein [Methanotorris formicicus]EHP83046.1 hypothetical protein MetfoDRAFT_2004 [Methanotorris formicicus Mc-S-70]
MKFRGLLFLGILFVLGLVYAGYVEYNESFDTSQDFTITYKYVPNVSSDDLDYTNSWVFHWVQDASWDETEYGKRFEVGYWYNSKNNHQFEIKLGATNKTCYMIKFPDLEMEKGKEYYFTIVKNGTNIKFYVNGKPYNGIARLAKSWKNGFEWLDWEYNVTGGSITIPENFTLANATSSINFNPTYHKRHMPRIDYGFIASPYAKSEDEIREDLKKLGFGNKPVKTPIPLPVVAITLILITLMLGDKIWERKY